MNEDTDWFRSGALIHLIGDISEDDPVSFKSICGGIFHEENVDTCGTPPVPEEEDICNACIEKLNDEEESMRKGIGQLQIPGMRVFRLSNRY